MRFDVDHTILKPFVKKIWTVSNYNIQKGIDTFRFYADGYPGIMFQQSEQGMFLNKTKKLATLFLYGQTVKPIAISAWGNYRIIIFYLYPHVMKSLFRIPAGEVTDTCIDLSTFALNQKESIVDKLLNTDSESDQIALLKSFLIKLIKVNDSNPDRSIYYAVSQIMGSSGGSSLKRLRRDLQFSERTFERRFEQYVGVTPKIFSNICRFRASLAKLESGSYEKLSDIAFENGYADHSHFIRSFKEFTGVTPREFIKSH